MSFEQLIAKVRQAEDSLESQERRVAADVRQLKGSWREAWTPGRIVIAGLASGFMVGRAEPLRAVANSGNLVQIVSALAGLFAGGSAQAAADEAERAAASAEQVVAADTDSEVEALARTEATAQAARAAAVEPTEP
ncbi:hypothetical protein ACFOLC_10060 [Lysobacter cavernae]|uniref:Protein sip-5 n=1 Tax=Lysobacter cavernae TaxID=1685901 RepID=A0ABV7RT05_9GAMM